ncbi:hypothetical protein AAMO2058_001722500 [Amorphochlora amoebiformis]
MFLVWKEFLVGNKLTANEIIGYLFQLAVGGFLFGLACAIPAVFWLSQIFSNPAVETTITFATAYLCFWLAESKQAGIKVSGVLAVVALGIAVNRFKYYISVQAEETVHHFWEMVGFVANTLIFLISGIVVSQRLFSGSDHIKGSDFGFLLVVYILIHMIRALAITILAYPMAKMGYGFDWRIGTILCYGGLRGAVGLALALMVDLDPDIPNSISDRILFHVSGIVALTLLVNGSTCGLLLDAVGLKRIRPSKLRAYMKAVESIKAESQMKTMSMRNEKMFQMADWKLVKKYLPQYEKKDRDLALAVVGKLPFHLTNADVRRMFNDKKKPKHKRQISGIDQNDMKRELMHRLLTAMSAHFIEAYEEGQISREAIPILAEAAETALDAESLDVLWTTIDMYFDITPMVKKVTSCWPWLADKIYLHHYHLAVELAVAFIHALHVIDKAETLFSEFSNHGLYQALKEKVHNFKEKAQKRWDQVEMDFPNIYNSMQTLFAIRRLLESEGRAIDKLFLKGIIDENEKLRLKEALERQMHWLQGHAIENTKRVTSKEVISQIEIWDKIPNHLQRHLLAQKRLAVSHEEKVPCSKTKMYYVMQGMLQILDEKENVIHTIGIGGLFGTWAALNNSKYLAHAVSQSDPAVLLEIEKHMVHDFCQHKEAHDILWKISAADFFVMRAPEVFRTSWRRVYRICTGSVVHETKEDSRVIIKHLAVLLKGFAACFKGEKKSAQKFYAPDLLSLENGKYEQEFDVSKGSVYITFPNVAPAVYSELKPRETSLRVAMNHELASEPFSLPAERPLLLPSVTAPERKRERKMTDPEINPLDSSPMDRMRSLFPSSEAPDRANESPSEHSVTFKGSQFIDISAPEGEKVHNRGLAATNPTNPDYLSTNYKHSTLQCPSQIGMRQSFTQISALNSDSKVGKSFAKRHLSADAAENLQL